MEEGVAINDETPCQWIHKHFSMRSARSNYWGALPATRYEKWQVQAPRRQSYWQACHPWAAYKEGDCTPKGNCRIKQGNAETHCYDGLTKEPPPGSMPEAVSRKCSMVVVGYHQPQPREAARCGGSFLLRSDMREIMPQNTDRAQMHKTKEPPEGSSLKFSLCIKGLYGAP